MQIVSIQQKAGSLNNMQNLLLKQDIDNLLKTAYVL